MGGERMSSANRYKWLIIVEGSTDVETYSKLLSTYRVYSREIHLVHAGIKGIVCNTNAWSNPSHIDLYNRVINDIGRADFCGIILLVDSDSNNVDAFNAYQRNANLSYVEPIAPVVESRGCYWYIDKIDGRNQVPIYGINVPINSTGCLESDLLASYGFPVEGQPEYEGVVDAIQKASNHWQIPKHGDGKQWWEENQKAKLDKFIYAAFAHGFEVSREQPTLPSEPNVIQNIKATIGVNSKGCF
jgi:hypothetical protein